MKKINVTLLFVFIYLGLSAQYKKASFFGKQGRTYTLGTRLYAMGDGRGTPLGITIAFGRDQEGQRFFFWQEFQFIRPYSFSFETTDVNGNATTVSGKAKTQIIYALNYAFHLLKNEGEEQKLQPYFTFGLNFKILGGTKYIDGNDSQNQKYVPENSFGVGLGAGLGTLINFAPHFSVKLEGGYTYMRNVTADTGAGDTYYMLKSNPYGSVGVRYRIAD